MSPKVSVIVPVYNVAEYLGQCLDTILLQTLQDIEVICVDDGSTDNSLEILNTYAFLDERIKVIHQENAGAAAARNRGLKEATGEFISVLDSDDFFHPEMLEKMVAKAEEDESDVVICGYTVFDDATQEDYTATKLPQNLVYRSPFAPSDIGLDLFMFSYLQAWTKLVRSSFIKKHNIHFDESVRYCDDNMFSLWVIGVAKKISCMPDLFIHYRWNTTGQQSAHKPLTLTKDHCSTHSQAYIHIKESNPNYNLVDCFIPRVRKSLVGDISDLEHNQKRNALHSIRKNLHPDLYNGLFGSKNPPISIIVCVYNGAEFLPECLDSCLEQTLKEIEIICVDDGSTDNTLDILKKYAKKDNRIKVIHQENKGLPISRNNATKLAKGEYIQFLDADDWIEPDTCECLYLYAKIYNLDMLSFAAKEFKNDTKIEFEDPYHCLKWLPEKFKPAFTWQDIPTLAPYLAVTSGLTIYKLHYLREHNIQWINKKICYEDTLFFHETLLQGAVMGALTDKFCHKRTHAASITQNMDKNFGDFCKIVSLILQKCKQLSIPENVFMQYFYRFTSSCYNQYIKKLDSLVRIKMSPFLYKLYLHLLKNYPYPLNNELYQWCLRYLGDQSHIEKLRFYFYSWKAQWKFSGGNIIGISVSPPMITILNKQIALPKKTDLKIKKEIIPEKDRYILCFDLFDPTTEAIDAYTFFCYLQKKGIPSKYIIHPLHPLLQKITNTKDIVYATSHTFFAHNTALLAQSKAVVTSFGLDSEKNKIIKKLPWLKYIFIDHGSILLKHSVLDIYTPKYFDYICANTKPEHSLYQKKGMWKHNQILCGMPRWENLKRFPHKNKNILIFFTWRISIKKYPVSQKQYENLILNFLNSTKLNTLLTKNNITLNMALHHALLTNNGNIDVPDNINLISSTEISQIIGSTDLLITDYSSIMFDFMFLDIPVIFYRFDDDVRYPDKRDRLNAKSAKSHDKELYNVFYNEDAVIKKIEFYIKNNFVLEPEYKKINDSLFWEKENICEHLYEKLNSL